MIISIYIFSLYLAVIISQSTQGGRYVAGCALTQPETTGVPNPSSFCDTKFECESGFFKLELNSFTPNVNASNIRTSLIHRILL